MRIGNAAKQITLGLALLAAGGQTRADELRVLSAASMQAVFKEIVDDFERGSGPQAQPALRHHGRDH